jgi:AraC-like DNA-binding protein
MKATLKKIGEGADNIFNVLIENSPNFYPYWHYHPQYEIMLIEKSTGTRYVGDSISPFQEGDITFLGSDIPHLFRNHPEYFSEKSKKKAKATVLYFSDEFINSGFFQLREMGAINELLQLSKRGIIINGSSKKEVARRLKKIVKGESVIRLLDFISLLNYIASKGEYEVLSSLGFTHNLDKQDLSRLNKIFDYLLNNFQKSITLDDVSKVANMSKAAFCRYFKDRTNKTLITFLNEIRIGHACKLLIENNNMNISEICYECGFNNLTNFNIQFKKLKKMNPMLYRETYHLS